MSNAGPRYTAYLAVQEDPVVAGELRAWADAMDSKLAVVLREALSAGLEALRDQWRARAGGELDPEFLAWHVQQAVAGHKWARRRRGETTSEAAE